MALLFLIYVVAIMWGAVGFETLPKLLVFLGALLGLAMLIYQSIAPLRVQIKWRFVIMIDNKNLSVHTRMERGINLVGIYALSGLVVLELIAQWVMHQQPCPLCILQRLGLIGISTAGLLNLRFGFKPSHYGLGLLCAFMGGAVAIRQTFLFIATGVRPVGSISVVGYDFWWWALLAYALASVGMAVALIVQRPGLEPRPMLDKTAKLSFVFVFLVAVANVLAIFKYCRWTLCG